MNTFTDPPSVIAAPLDSRWLGNLQVNWQANRMAPDAWSVHGELQLGEAKSLFALDALSPAQPFQLYSSPELAWGKLLLQGDESGRFIRFMIEYRCGAATEQPTSLCSWKVCRPCEPVAPREGQQTFGAGGWIKVGWRIAGSEAACLAVTIRLSLYDDATVREQTLTPLKPAWWETVDSRDGHTEVGFSLHVDSTGNARVDVLILHAEFPAESAELARLPVAPAPPMPIQDDTPNSGVIIGRPREFASFVYPRGMQAPSAAQLSRRFVPASNASPFQAALSGLKTGKDRKGMQAAAQDFTAPDSKSYPGQYVGDIASLPPPMGRIEGARVRALLAMQPHSLDELQAAVTALLGLPIAEFLGSQAYPGQLMQLQNSLLALLVLETRRAGHEEALIQALLVCHVAELIAGSPSLLDTPQNLREPLSANVLLPAAIFPLPPAAPAAGGDAPATEASGYAKALGFADLKVIKQRLLRYRPGELAHIENVMRGEYKENGESHSRRSESKENDSSEQSGDESREQGYQGRSEEDGQTATNPIGDLKREFDSLDKNYSTDGLSETVTGGWKDSFDGPQELNGLAIVHAQGLLDRAASRVAQRIGSVRSRRSVEEFVAHKLRRFHNAEGNKPIVGIYRWVDEVRQVHLEHRGTRLILEYTVPDPAADYVQRNNVLHGNNVTAPVPPWQISDPAIGPIHSAADITRANYAPLAALYDARDIVPPPAATRMVSAALLSDPPRALAQLAVPDGYSASSALIGYAWTARATPSATPAATSLDILVGGTTQKIDTSQDANPGSKTLDQLQASDSAVPVAALAAGIDYVVNISLTCSCQEDGPAFQRWQMATYEGIMAAYQARKQAYFRVMDRLAEGISHTPAERRREIERAALEKGAIEGFIAPFLAQLEESASPESRDVANFNLIPFFHNALAWNDMTYAFYGCSSASGDPVPHDWLSLIQAKSDENGFHVFLEAAAARLLVAVQPEYILPMLFYLASAGGFWFGEARWTPVHDSDCWLANEFKSLAESPPQLPDSAPWEIEVATSMLMLQDDQTLPDFSASSSKHSGGIESAL